MDIAKAINEVKAGRIEFKMDKQSNVNVLVGKASFTEEAICQNIKTLLDALMHAKPSGVKGQFIRSVSVSTTMGAGMKLTNTVWKRA